MIHWSASISWTHWRTGTVPGNAPMVVSRLTAIFRVDLYWDRKCRPSWREQATARSELWICIRTKCICELLLDLSGAPALQRERRDYCWLLRFLHAQHPSYFQSTCLKRTSAVGSRPRALYWCISLAWYSSELRILGQIKANHSICRNWLRG